LSFSTCALDTDTVLRHSTMAALLSTGKALYLSHVCINIINVAVEIQT